MIDLSGVRAGVCDTLGTTVDWRTGVAEQSDELLHPLGIELDGGLRADEGRERYLPSIDGARSAGLATAFLEQPQDKGPTTTPIAPRTAIATS